MENSFRDPIHNERLLQPAAAAGLSIVPASVPRSISCGCGMLPG